MKDPYEVLKRLEAEFQKLNKQIVCLKIAIPLLKEEGDRKPEGQMTKLP